MFVVEIVVFLVRIVIHTGTGFDTVTLIPKDHCDMKHGPDPRPIHTYCTSLLEPQSKQTEGETNFYGNL